MKTFWEGLIKKNPVLVLALGLMPAVAIARTAEEGLDLGFITTAVFLVAAMIRFVLAPAMPGGSSRILEGQIVVVLTVLVYGLLFTANPGLVARLGIFLPLIVANTWLLQGNLHLSQNHSPSM